MDCTSFVLKQKIMRKVIFEGKTQVAQKWVDLKIYKVCDDVTKDFCYYEWDTNPYLVDKNQMGVHRGEINLGHTLEEILFRIEEYKNEIRDVKEVVANPNF